MTSLIFAPPFLFMDELLPSFPIHRRRCFLIKMYDQTSNNAAERKVSMWLNLEDCFSTTDFPSLSIVLLVYLHDQKKREKKNPREALIFQFMGFSSLGKSSPVTFLAQLWEQDEEKEHVKNF